MASKEGWATEPHRPTMKARTTCASSVPQTAQPAAVMAMSQSEHSSSCCSVMRLRSRPTSTSPTMAPAPLPARTSPYQYRPTPFMRRSPKASMKVMKPVRPRTMHMALSPSITSGLAKGCRRIRSCSRVEASPSWPYSRTFVDWSVHSSLRPAAREHGQPGPGHRGGDEHDRGQDEHGRGARHLVEDHGGDRDDEAGQGAEERQPRVEGGVAGLLARPSPNRRARPSRAPSAPLVTR